VSDPAIWRLSDARTLRLERPCVVGILNATPDSFSDGGEIEAPGAALARAQTMVDQGADMLDVGGESTRPGAARVGEDEQIRRVVPVIEEIRGAGITVPLSVDTTRARVAAAALGAGADVVNDVSGMLEDDAMGALVAERGCGVVLMHRLTTPELDAYSDSYGEDPDYGDVVAHVRDALAAMLDRAVGLGVDPESVLLDPGLGFGKSVADNAALIRGTAGLVGLGRPVLSALSRKSFVGRIGLGRDSEPWERVEASVGMSVAHMGFGARVFRVHDVGAHRAALDAAWGLMGPGGGETRGSGGLELCPRRDAGAP
jgi:dihydropteroate synthase